MNYIDIRFKTPSKQRKNWWEGHHFPDYQSQSVTDAIEVVKSKYPEAYDIEATVYENGLPKTSR